MVKESLLRSPVGVRSFGSFDGDIDFLVDPHKQHGLIILPWNHTYRFWWHLTALGAILTAFLAPYQVAFEEDPGVLKQSADVLEKALTLLFSVDIIINFKLAFFKDEELVCNEWEIAREYMSCMLWELSRSKVFWIW